MQYVEDVLHARHCTGLIRHIPSFSPREPHKEDIITVTADEETDLPRLRNLLKGIQLLEGGARICSQVFFTLDAVLFLLPHVASLEAST